MSDDGSHANPQKSWLERLGDILLREPQDRLQLVKLLRDAENRDLLDADALSMIEGVLQVSDMRVRDIMIPRSQMVVVEANAAPHEFIPLLIEEGHSRFPVVGENKDEVRGILHAKALLRYLVKDTFETNFNLLDVVRPATFVPESKRLNILLKEFRDSHNHMAIVMDEYGGVCGLVTIEDVLEQIVGEIEDEYDVDEDETIKKIRDHVYSVTALTELEEFNERFNTNLHEEDVDTVGGLLLHHLGHLPKRGESLTLGAIQFKIVHADKRRIRLVEVTLPEGHTEHHAT